MTTRVLGARRLSRMTDTSTSFDRQGLAIEDVTRAIGGRVVDWADDPDVSAAKVAPKDRPELGPWLLRPDEYDAIAWWRLDRAVRSMRDMAWLAGWARDHKKRLIFAEGPGGGRLELDMTSPMSELILMILAFAAQMEVQAIQERTSGASEYLRTVGRWSGGRIPFGRIPVPHPREESGWWLDKHDDSAEIIEDIVSLVLDKKSYNAVAAWLNLKHPAKTPANHRRALAHPPREPKEDARWNPGMVSSLLRQPSLRGWGMLNGEPVRDEEGEPVKIGPPLIDDVTWRRLQVEMDSRELPDAERNKSDAHPLLGVLFCGTCGGKLYQGWMSPGPNRKVAKRQYRCAAKAHGRVCAKPAYVSADPVDAYVDEKFTAHFGRVELVEVITIPGVDHRDEIAELTADIQTLAGQLGNMRGAAAAAVAKQLQGRSDKLERLEAQPVVPARTEEVRTGVTYAEAWMRAKARGDIGECREMLRNVGVRVEVGETYRGARDVTARLSFDIVTPDHVDLEQDALDDAAYQSSL
ncbi:recombinase family protein [Streptomyces sp. ISL-43]|uniref:recombinase family protein n=1 Tax=Streptomyces sp. ISL-43 TaxID=2819183 RepID=UPI001BE58BFB|nr:recombinase family protein [Streptomyces sp. ISL-43]MBT2446504.1 recombinase family protein [Streptomyces sp. ISL-43]